MKTRNVFLPLIMSSLLLAGCNAPSDGVVPVAYTRFEASGTQYLVYTSYVYATSNGHIQVWKDEAESHEQFGLADIVFTFTKTCGADKRNDVQYMLVDLSVSYLEMTVDLIKDSDAYSDSKKVYLNGEELTPYNTYDGDTLKVLSFKNLNFKRTNPGGQLNYSLTNVLEYK